jgi:hypothetical protein
MPNPRANSLSARSCTDPIVGAILSGWRYDISSIPPEMRTAYEGHLADCAHCRRRQTIARTIDVLLLAVSTLSVAAFLLAVAVLRRIERIVHIQGVTLHLHHEPITISLGAVALAGLLVSAVLWILVAVATPLPSFISDVVQQRLPADLRQRLARRHA